MRRRRRRRPISMETAAEEEVAEAASLVLVCRRQLVLLARPCCQFTSCNVADRKQSKAAVDFSVLNNALQSTRSKNGGGVIGEMGNLRARESLEILGEFGLFYTVL